MYPSSVRLLSYTMEDEGNNGGMRYDFSAGFQTSPAQIAILIGILALLGLVLIIPLFVGEPKRKRRDSAPPMIRLDHPRVRITLSESEEATLARIGWYVKDKGKRARLMSDHHLLRQAAKRALRDGTIGEQETVRLCRTLGVDSTPLFSRWTSTASIGIGSMVTVSDVEAHVAAGAVLLCDESGLRIKLDKGRTQFGAGRTVDALCVTDTGIYRFSTTVIGQDGRVLNLKHTTNVTRAQRRRYRRLRMQLRAEVAMMGLNQAPLKAKTLDISGGGAALTNPKKRFTPSSQVACTLLTPNHGQLPLTGTVVRTSKRNRVMHVRFFGIDDAKRHELFALLYQVGGSTREP